MKKSTSAAKLALKLHALASNPELLAAADGDNSLQEITSAVNLTEAPEDAVTSIVVDLLDYCERGGIDWAKDVIPRARARLHSERGSHLQDR